MKRIEMSLCAAAWSALSAVGLAQAADEAPVAATAETAADAQAAAAPESTIPVASEAQPAAEPDQPASSSRLVEEIVVTAQKREQAVQDVPIAVAAFSASQLEAMGVDNTKELSRVTPGLQLTEFAGFTLVYLRGVGTDSFLPYSDPSVATYIDGLYIPAQQGLVNSFGGIERVEVLKGPQGTLFGRNSTGGAINVITKTPDQVAESSVQAEVGNFGTRKAQVYTSFPVLDTLATSLSAFYTESDPYYTQITGDLGPLEHPPEDKLSGDESKGARVKVRWTPTDDLDFVLSGYRLLQEGTGSTIGALKKPSVLATALGIEPETADYAVHRNEKTDLQINNTVIAGNAKWSLPYFDLKAIVGKQEIVTDDAYYDFDNSAKDLISFFTHNAYSKVTTAELQIASNENSWRADRFKWIGGFYYLHSSGGYDPIKLEVAGGPALIPSLGVLTPDQLDLINGILPDVGIRANIHGVLETNAYSGFVQGDYDFTDWFNLTLGGRYQEEDRFLTEQNVQIDRLDGSEAELINYNQPKVTQKNFSPRVSLNLRPLEDVLVYTSWSKGYKSGTYNGINIYTPPTYVEPEEVTSYEFGVKSESFNGALRLNGALFYTDVKNQQVTFVSLTNGGAITFENAGAARIKGAELDALMLPMPDANPGLVLTGGVAYLDSIFTEYENASGFDETTGLFFNKTGDFTGNRVPRSPEWSGNAGINQTIDFDSGSLEMGVDVYYNGGFFYTAQNTDVAKQKAYSLLNARVSYLYQPWQVRVTVFGQNLDNETYSFAQFTADFGTNYTLAPPRTYGLRVNWDF